MAAKRPARVVPTSASKWKRPAEEVVELPSGNKARLRRPQIIPMLQRGEIPNPLMQAALRLHEGTAEAEEISPQDMVDFMAWIISQAFVEPPVVVVGDAKERGQLAEDEVPEGSLAFHELDDSDVEFVIGWWQGGSAAFETFRDERSGDPDGGDGADVLDPALVAARD